MAPCASGGDADEDCGDSKNSKDQGYPHVEICCLLMLYFANNGLHVRDRGSSVRLSLLPWQHEMSSLLSLLLLVA